MLLNRVAFTIFGIDVYYYGLIISCAILLCVICACVLCKIKKIDTGLPLEIFLAIIPLGIICARLFSVIFEDGLTIADFFKFSTGGMSIIGAIIGGAIGILVYKCIKKMPFLAIADIVTSVLMLGQSIGRWGNYFNSEVYGKEILDSSFQFFPIAVNIGGSWYQALFFYESVLTAIGFIALVIIFIKTKKTGLCTGIYLVYYGIIRVVLENIRQPQYILKWGNVPVSALISSMFIVIGIVVLILTFIKRDNKEKRVG